MKTTFRPTLALEMDLMKSLLQDINKLKLTIEEEIVEEFWLNQQNKRLYLILKLELLKNQDENPYAFYVSTLGIAEKIIPNFDESVYEELFEMNFNYENAFFDYYHYFKSKKVSCIFSKLANYIDNVDFDFDEVFDEIALGKKELNDMIDKKKLK